MRRTSAVALSALVIMAVSPGGAALSQSVAVEFCAGTLAAAACWYGLVVPAQQAAQQAEPEPADYGVYADPSFYVLAEYLEDTFSPQHLGMALIPFAASAAVVGVGALYGVTGSMAYGAALLGAFFGEGLGAWVVGGWNSVWRWSLVAVSTSVLATTLFSVAADER